jgi:hypothetical protein
MAVFGAPNRTSLAMPGQRKIALALAQCQKDLTRRLEPCKKHLF